MEHEATDESSKAANNTQSLCIGCTAGSRQCCKRDVFTVRPFAHLYACNAVSNTNSNHRCPAYDNSERAAFLEQQRKLKAERDDIQVLVRKRRKAKEMAEQNTSREAAA